LRIKFTKSALLERLGIDEQSLIEFIKLGLLIPEGWDNLSFSELVLRLHNDFKAVWSIAEVERFELVMRTFQKNYHLFARQLNLRFDDVQNSIASLSTKLDDHDHTIKFLLAQIQKSVDEQFEYIDANEFCETTGYSKRHFYNSIRIIDPNVPTMKLNIAFYKSLLWVKRGRKWMTRRSEFEELRKNFTYDVLLVEKHRKEK